VILLCCLCLVVVSVNAKCEENEWRPAIVVLKGFNNVSRVVRGLILDNPNQPLFLNKGTGPVKYSRNIIIKIEDPSKEEAITITKEVENLHQNVVKQQQKIKEKQSLEEQRRMQKKEAEEKEMANDHLKITKTKLEEVEINAVHCAQTP